MPRPPTDALCSPLISIAEALRPEADGGVPDAAGFYAWWVRPDALPHVPGAPHPSEPYGLLYVGIAPSRATSSATLRSRLLGQHIGGNVGSSTFRRSLAALLFERECWTPVRTTTRELLTADDNANLSAWQREHLRLAWLHVVNSWEGEAEVIAEMQPALNLAGNASHPFYATMSEARRRFKAAAH